jgi:hypothetical protein
VPFLFNGHCHGAGIIKLSCAAAKFGLLASNMKFSTQNEE